MPRSGPNGTYTLPGAQDEAQPNTTIQSSINNQGWADIEQTFNTPQPVAYGGTGATDAQGAVSAIFDGTTYVLDDNLRIAASGDTSKLVKLDLSDLSTATTRTLTVPNRNGTISFTNDIDVRRNRIVNGDMRVSQEMGVQASTSNGYYAADQWATYRVTSAGTITSARVASVSPAGSPYRYRVTITTPDASLAAGEYLTISQNLEGSNVVDFQYGGANAKDSVLRFGFKAPAGTYAVALHNSAANRSFVALFTVGAGDANTDTVQEIAIPGDTTGTWLTADGVIGITLDIVLACGSTFQGVEGWQAGNILGTSAVSNGMGTGGAVFELFDVGNKLDPDATGVYGQYEVGDVHPVYRAERYCWKRHFDIGDRLAVAAIVTAALAEFNYTLPVEPAKEPAMVVNGDWTLNVNAGGSTANIPTTLSLQASVSDILWLRAGVSGASEGQAGQIRADTAGSIFFNARLS